MAKKKAKPAPKKRRPSKENRQPNLPGAEPGTFDREIHEAAEEYNDVKLARMDLTEKEVAANARLVEIMVGKGKVVYEHDGVHVDLTNTQKAKVKIDKAPAVG